MNQWLKPPRAVGEAKEAQKGMHLILEILVFIAVFFVCTIGEVLVVMPVQIIVLMRNQDYLDAVASGDLNRVAEVSAQIANADTLTIANLFATVMMIIIIFLFCRFIQKRKLSTLGFTGENALIHYGRGLVIGFVIFSLAVCICIFTGALKLEMGQFALPVFLLYAAGYGIQGMAEEVLCRGYFMVSIGRRYPMAVAVLVNSMAFAALHLFNPGVTALALLNLTLFGIFASVCFIKTGNIWMAGAIHSMWNLVQGNVYGIKVSGLDSACSIFSAEAAEGKAWMHGGDFGLEGGLAITIVLVIGIACFLLIKKNGQDTETDLEENRIKEDQ